MPAKWVSFGCAVNYASYLEFGTRKFAAATSVHFLRHGEEYAAQTQEVNRRWILWRVYDPSDGLDKEKGIDEDAAYPIARENSAWRHRAAAISIPGIRDSQKQLIRDLNNIKYAWYKPQFADCLLQCFKRHWGRSWCFIRRFPLRFHRQPSYRTITSIDDSTVNSCDLSTTITVEIHTWKDGMNSGLDADLIARQVYDRIYPNPSAVLTLDGAQMVNTRVVNDQTQDFISQQNWDIFPGLSLSGTGFLTWIFLKNATSLQK